MPPARLITASLVVGIKETGGCKRNRNNRDRSASYESTEAGGIGHAEKETRQWNREKYGDRGEQRESLRHGWGECNRTPRQELIYIYRCLVSGAATAKNGNSISK